LFVDAGTVHAIGPGVVLLETQQTSDVTYRLYDYGRPRELHLEQGIAVIKTETAAGKVAPRVMDGFTRLIEQKYFVVDRFDVADGEVKVEMSGAGCLVGLCGRGVVKAANAEVEFSPGQAVIVPVGDGGVTVSGEAGLSFVRCVAP
jgi:mannose-6-phosphate isomerase